MLRVYGIIHGLAFVSFSIRIILCSPHIHSCHLVASHAAWGEDLVALHSGIVGKGCARMALFGERRRIASKMVLFGDRGWINKKGVDFGGGCQIVRINKGSSLRPQIR